MPVCWRWVVSANSLYICALRGFNTHEPWGEGEPAMIMTICHLSCLLVSLFMLALKVNFNCNEIHSNKCSFVTETNDSLCSKDYHWE